MNIERYFTLNQDINKCLDFLVNNNIIPREKPCPRCSSAAYLSINKNRQKEATVYFVLFGSILYLYLFCQFSTQI